jgi:hypothetical protein
MFPISLFRGYLIIDFLVQAIEQFYNSILFDEIAVFNASITVPFISPS